MWHKARRDGVPALIKSAAEAVRKEVWWEYERRRQRDTVDHCGIRLDLTLDVWNDAMYLEVVNGTYEREEAEFVRQYLPTSCNVVELGGGSGFVSCLIASHLDSDSRLITLEPNPDAVTAIEAHRDLNGLDFTTYHTAYSTESTPVAISVPEKGVWGGARKRDDAIARVFRAPSLSLAELFEREELDTAAVVADIEGEEAALLTEELDLLERRVPILVVEFHHRKPEYQSRKTEIQRAKKRLESSCFRRLDEDSDVIVYENLKL